MSGYIPVADKFTATTRSGTRYEFEIADKGDDNRMPNGRVRKVGEEWEECYLLGPLNLGYPMHMALGNEYDSPTRHTTSIVDITITEGVAA